MTDVLAVEPHTAPPPRSAGDIAYDAQAVVHVLRERLAAAERDVAAIPAKREALAFGASQGNRKAKTALLELATAEASASRDCGDLRAALAEARRRLEEARVAERAERDEADLATAQLLADQFVAESARIDRALADIGEAHRRRSDLRRRIAATGCLENLSHLECWIRLRLAVAHAGVFEILCPGVNAPSRDDATALAASDRRTLSNLAPRNTRAR